MRTHKFVSLVVLAVVVFAAGCTHIAIPAMFEPGSETYTVDEVSVAVDGNGTKHILLSERLIGELYADHVYYIRSKSGETALKTGYSYMGGTTTYPDIATSNSGTAYLVWLLYSEGTYKHMWATLAPGDDSMQGIAQIETGLVGYRAPKVAGPVVNSAADRVYAVYEVQNNTGSALRYRELSNPTNMGWVSAHPGNAYYRKDHSLAVGTDGIMHVAWIEDSGKSKYILYNNNYAKTGDLTPDIPVAGGDLSSLPAVAAGASAGTSYGFIVYYLQGSPNDLLYVSVYVCNGTCTMYVPHLINLGNKSWQMSSNPSAVAYGDTVYITFAADNSDTSGNADEIFLATYDFGSSTDTITKITDNDGENKKPKITLTTDLSNSLPVIAWFYDDPAVTNHQVQMYDAYHDSIMVLDTDLNDDALYFGLDLANGNYIHVAGVWTGPEAPKKDVIRNVVWLSYNDYGIFLPLISR